MSLDDYGDNLTEQITINEDAKIEVIIYDENGNKVDPINYDELMNEDNDY